jgi:flavin reductase (DIM6/NTAB) family NADH-FMN oxidoreductase RutF
MTANSFTSVSLNPPLISVCVDQQAHLLPLLKEKRVFGVNILRADQQKLSEFFSRPEQSEKEELTLQVRFRWTKEGIPLLEDVLCQVACLVTDLHPAGDHTIVVGEVLSAALHSGEPLIFFRGDYTHLPR